MSLDEQNRKNARRARMEAEAGDQNAPKAQAAENARMGGGYLAFLSPLLETWVYIEGARMNYRGKLVDFFLGFDGQPTGLVLDPCYRVGDWNETPTTEKQMEGAHVVTWGSVCEIGPQAKNWPTR